LRRGRDTIQKGGFKSFDATRARNRRKHCGILKRQGRSQRAHPKSEEMWGPFGASTPQGEKKTTNEGRKGVPPAPKEDFNTLLEKRPY